MYREAIIQDSTVVDYLIKVVQKSSEMIEVARSSSVDHMCTRCCTRSDLKWTLRFLRPHRIIIIIVFEETREDFNARVGKAKFPSLCFTL